MATSKQKQNQGLNPVPPPSKSAPEITEQQIAERAYAIYLARGGADGYDLDDWLQAETQFRVERWASRQSK